MRTQLQTAGTDFDFGTGDGPGSLNTLESLYITSLGLRQKSDQIRRQADHLHRRSLAQRNHRLSVVHSR